MEITKGKLKGLLRESFISGGRYYIKGHIKENIGKVIDFDTWYNENVVRKLFIADVIVPKGTLFCDCSLPTNNFKLDTGEICCCLCEKELAK